MVRTLDEVMASLPAEEREWIEARARVLIEEVETLRALRQVLGKAQGEIAARLKVKQPSVSKLEKQTDMYLSTLRGYVEALGGKLELVVHFPERAPVRIERLGDLTGAEEAPSRPVKRRPAKAKAKVIPAAA
jgi:transcriptional regulator with XRE-family HTH domain